MNDDANANSTAPSLFPVGVFTGLYMLAAVATASVTRNMEFVFYIVVMFILISCILLVHRRVRLTVPLLWALSLWGAAHMAGGLVPAPESWPTTGHQVLYSWWLIPNLLKYDNVIHAYGFGVTTWLCWQGLCGAIGPCRPTFGLMVLTAAAGLGFGALNEVIEFFATLLTTTNVGGYVNTGWDLVANTIGATTAVVLIYLTERRTVHSNQ